MDKRVLEKLEGRRVLVTGAGGSIGTELVRQILAATNDTTVIALNVSETAIFNMRQNLRSPGRLQCLLGSVRDRLLLERLFAHRDISVVIHAAAHKHVPICEENVCEAVLNNVFGTRTLLDAAISGGVEDFTFISTDKAVEPTSVMGATKAICESLVRRESGDVGAFWRPRVVRFGNVRYSAGSVLPLWEKQILAGQPVTITDRRCTRFMMTIDEACRLVLDTLILPPYETYVFDMGDPVNMFDEALNLMDKLGREVPVEEIGLRPGEKLMEELYPYGVVPEKTKVPKILRLPHFPPTVFLRKLEEAALRRNDVEVRGLLMEMV